MIKVGLYLHGNDHTIEKYSQALSLLGKLHEDSRFMTYLVVDPIIPDKVKKILSELKADALTFQDSLVIGPNKLDCMIIITPYPPHPEPHFRKWETKIIYKEYGTTGIDLGYKNIWKQSAIYKYSDMIICDNPNTKQELLDMFGVDKGVIGSPAYDYKFTYKKHEYNDGLKHVLWTPHHSIYSNKTYDGIFGGRYSTFLTYRYFIPELVYKYPIKIHVKIHPNTERRYKQYCKENHIHNDYKEYIEWLSKINNVEIIGNEDYYQLFMNSDAILNDSISFLQEYLPTENPMLVLYDEGRASYNEYGEYLIDKCYYRSYNKSDIESFIQNIVINENDILKSNRSEFLKNYYIDNNKPNVDSLLDIIYNKFNERSTNE